MPIILKCKVKRKIAKLSILCSAVADHSTHIPRMKGSNTTSGHWENGKIINLMSRGYSTMAEQLIRHPKVKGSNLEASGEKVN